MNMQLFLLYIALLYDALFQTVYGSFRVEIGTSIYLSQLLAALVPLPVLPLCSAIIPLML